MTMKKFNTNRLIGILLLSILFPLISFSQNDDFYDDIYTSQDQIKTQRKKIIKQRRLEEEEAYRQWLKEQTEYTEQGTFVIDDDDIDAYNRRTKKAYKGKVSQKKLNKFGRKKIKRTGLYSNRIARFHNPNTILLETNDNIIIYNDDYSSWSDNFYNLGQGISIYINAPYYSWASFGYSSYYYNNCLWDSFYSHHTPYWNNYYHHHHNYWNSFGYNNSPYYSWEDGYYHGYVAGNHNASHFYNDYDSYYGSSYSNKRYVKGRKSYGNSHSYSSSNASFRANKRVNKRRNTINSQDYNRRGTYWNSNNGSSYVNNHRRNSISRKTYRNNSYNYRQNFSRNIRNHSNQGHYRRNTNNSRRRSTSFKNNSNKFNSSRSYSNRNYSSESTSSRRNSNSSSYRRNSNNNNTYKRR